MPVSLRSRWGLAIGLGVVLVAGFVLLAIIRGPNLRPRLARVAAGMSREQVERVLGRPVLDLDRAGGRGTLLVWVDQLWQAEVRLGPDGRVESTACVPSDSFYRRTVGRILPAP